MGLIWETGSLQMQLVKTRQGATDVGRVPGPMAVALQEEKGHREEAMGKRREWGSFEPRNTKDGWGTTRSWAWGKEKSPCTSQGTWLCRHLDFRLLVSRTVRKQTPVASSPLACGTLFLWPTQETNTECEDRRSEQG